VVPEVRILLVLLFVVLEDFLDGGNVAIAPDSVAEDAVRGEKSWKCVGKQWRWAVWCYCLVEFFNASDDLCFIDE